MITGLAVMGLLTVNAQEKDPDTTRLNLGETQVLIIKTPKGTVVIKGDEDSTLTVEEVDEEDKGYSHDGKWSGIDFGVTMLVNNQFAASFPTARQWENDPAKSFYWNINAFDHRFNIYRDRIGITTGLGLNFTQIGLRNNYLLNENADSLWAVQDTMISYSKNKLRATYLQVPLLLEFNTSSDEDKSFYFAAGVVGGVRIGSSVKRKVDMDGFDSKQKIKGTYGLNAFKLDGTVRMGYGNWGLFANYNLLPLFDTDKTVAAYPLSFGLSLVF